MSRYRKVDPRIWNDAKFRALDDQGKLVFFFLLTHPHMTAIGAMRASVPGLAAEIGWSAEAFREAFLEASEKGMVRHDEKASLVWLPNFLRYNPPESPNVVKAWVNALDLLPECDLLTRVIAGAVAYTQGKNKGFQEALPEAFAKAMPIQEQEQEQEQEQDKDIPHPPAAAGSARPSPAKKTKKSRSATTPPDTIPQTLWDDFLAVRKQKRAPMTETALVGIRREAEKAGITLEAAIRICVERNWVGFNSSWDWNSKATGANHAAHQQSGEPRGRAGRFFDKLQEYAAEDAPGVGGGVVRKIAG